MKKLKILIANPPSYTQFKYVKEGRCESKKGGQLTPQITLGVISKILDEAGYPNDLYDFMATGLNKSIENKLKGYDLAIINVSTPSYESDKKFVKLLKINNKNCLTCAIGVLATALPKYVLQDFDICILGEPEITSKEIIESLAKGTSIYKIRGIAYKDKKIKLTKKRIPLDNLDILPFPDRDKIDLNLYKNPMTSKAFTVINIQRGCPFNCSFCTATFYHENKPRYRSIENVIKEIKLCVNKYHITDFLFLADTFTINKDYVTSLCEKIINENLKITWNCNSRIDTFSLELGKIMKKAGCKFISFGVESASKRILTLNSKKLDSSKAITVAKICKELGIVSMMYYILGFPEETDEEINSTIDLALKVKSDFARFFVATPLPGSTLYSDENISNIPNFSNFNLSEISINNSNVSNKRLNKLIKIAYFRFYFRPTQIIRILLIFDNFFSFIYYVKEYLRNYIFD